MSGVSDGIGNRKLVDEVLDFYGPLRLRFCPLAPTARQEAFLLLPFKEVFFGGAAGGGKSAALLMSALIQFQGSSCGLFPERSTQTCATSR
jgi:hypothetical protein